MITIQELIGKAIDTKNAKLAGQLVDKLRGEGCNYREIFTRVQAVRPSVTEAEWDALCYEADESDADE